MTKRMRTEVCRLKNRIDSNRANENVSKADGNRFDQRTSGQIKRLEQSKKQQFDQSSVEQTGSEKNRLEQNRIEHQDRTNQNRTGGIGRDFRKNWIQQIRTRQDRQDRLEWQDKSRMETMRTNCLVDMEWMGIEQRTVDQMFEQPKADQVRIAKTRFGS